MTRLYVSADADKAYRDLALACEWMNDREIYSAITLIPCADGGQGFSYDHATLDMVVFAPREALRGWAAGEPSARCWPEILRGGASAAWLPPLSRLR